MNKKDIHLEKYADGELAEMLLRSKYWEVDTADDFPAVNAYLMNGRSAVPLQGELASVTIEDREIINVFEEGPAKVRLYIPEKRTEETGILVLFRGSGFATGEAWLYDEMCGWLAYNADYVVVSSDYRLAPRFRYPAAFHDAYSALVWASENREALAGKNAKLVVMGMSAGGGLAVSAALHARDNNGPQIDLLCPLYPMLDPWNRGESNQRIISGYVWDGDKNGKGWQAYLGNLLNEDALPVEAAPVCADSYRGLPPVFSTIGQLDALQDELVEFIGRCTEDGVETEFHSYPGCFHAFEVNYPAAKMSKKARNVLRRKLIEIKTE